MYTKFVILLSLAFLFGNLPNDVLGQKIKNLDALCKNATLQSFQKEARDFLSIPNFALDKDGIDQNIKWLKNAFEKRNFDVQVLSTGGNDIVLVERKAKKSKTTLLFYMHFDGQNVDTTKWFQPSPYLPVLKAYQNDQWEIIDWSKMAVDYDPDWRVFARSASDDKGPILMMLSAIDILDEQKLKIPYNIKVILDSEEENGSPNLTDAVIKYKDLLAADHMVIVDGPMHDSGLPTIVHGIRGIATITLKVFGPVRPQHSGHFGNYAPNPAQRMASLLASMKDGDGRVIIPGYYDQVNLSPEIIAILDGVPDDEEQIKQRIGIAEPEKVGDNYQQSIQYPSLNVRGLSSGWVGEQSRTIVPDVAIAEIDIRTVPETKGNYLIALVRNHIERQGFHIIDNRTPTSEERMKHGKILSFRAQNSMNPFYTPLESRTAVWLNKALKETHQSDVVRYRLLGGSVPIAQFVKELSVPAVLVPLVNPDNNQHSPNENLRIGHFEKGIKSLVGIMTTKIN